MNLLLKVVSTPIKMGKGIMYRVFYKTTEDELQLAIFYKH